MEQVGILGGTFDPIHYGHLAIAEEVRYVLGLSRVYLIPSAHQPLKPGHAATPHQRMEMVCRACSDNPALIPSDRELQRPPPSFTIDTLRDLSAELHASGNHTKLWFILGADSAMSLPQWRDPHTILDLARLAIVVRPGTTLDIHALEKDVPGIAARSITVAGPRLDIASSMLRQRIAEGRPVRYQIPDAVLEYIVQQKLYCNDT